MRLTICLALLPFCALAQVATDAQGRPVVGLSNEKIELTVLTKGGTISTVRLREGSEKLSPLAGMGHFLCLDGFGAPSAEELKSGMPFHGEASKQLWKTVDSQSSGSRRSVTLATSLPLVQENLTRRFEIVDGDSVVYVESELESPLGFDRPVSWAEHATLGPPFLEKGKVAVDMPGLQCRVRAEKPGPIPGRLIYLRDFTWPMAPTRDGGQLDLRLIPTDQNSLDLASCQMDPKRSLAFVTALQLEKRLLFGYVFRREEYPWVMSWMNYTGDQRAARGMEFSTQPFDVSHRETVEMNPMFGTPTFRWLPAKSTIRSRFLVFYTVAPEGMTRVDDVTLSGGRLIIEDRKAGKRIELAASLPL